MHLAWDATIDPALNGYKLYYGKSTRNYDVIVDVGLVTDFVLTMIDETQPAFFAVTAYTTNGINESEYSTECVAIPILKKITGSPDSYIMLERGKPATLQITAPPDHRVSAIKVGQTWRSSSSTLTIDDVQENEQIEIVIQKIPTLTGMDY